MAKIKPNQLEKVIKQELTLYHKEVVDVVKKSARSNMRKLVAETKGFKYKKAKGAYKKAISSRTVFDTPNAFEMQWYVKAPHYRLTHLLEYGHATRNGGRTVAYGNLGKSSEKAQLAFEMEVEDGIKNAK